MKTTKHTLSALFVILFTCALILTGCSGSFDAKGYTKSFLDVIAKGDYTQYASLTNSSEDDAKKEREYLLDNSVNSLLTNVTVSDETKQKISNMFETIYTKWDYEVLDAQKNEDGSYSVPVKVRKLNAFSKAFTTTIERVQERLKTIDESDEQEYNDLFYQTFAETVNENTAKNNYSTAATISVKISPSEKDKNVYEIDDDSVQALFDGLMNLDALQEDAASASSAKSSKE